MGADDFIVKPFGVREVIARIRSVTRRCMAAQASDPNTTVFMMRDLEVLPAELKAKRGDHVIELSVRDIKILQLLHDQVGCVVNRNEMLDVCWGMDYLPNSRTLDQHISQLRKRIEIEPENRAIIDTVHGVGYRFEL